MRIISNTFRVYLRTITMDDAKAIKANSYDKEMALNVPSMPNPYMLEDIYRLVEHATQQYLLGYGYHMCICLKGGELIGLCALAEIDKTNRKAELGYWLGKRYRGKGYAKEALKLMMYFGFKKLDLNRVYAKVLVHNNQSIRLLDSLGFGNEGVMREDIFHNGNFVDDILFSMLKRDYREDAGIAVEDQ